MQTVLIAGASGRFGAHAKTAFEMAGWSVRVYDRKRETLMTASKGVDVIVNALNPPDYLNWESEVPRITNETIAAANASRATVLIPGNVYNFGTQPGPWSDQTPQHACSRKGVIRVEMEAAYRASGVRTIILRAGDFIDETATGTWLDQVIFKSIAKGKFVYPGGPDISHAWAYLPDLANAAAGLATKRAELEAFCDVSFAGYAVTGRALMKAAEHNIRRSLKFSQGPWWPVKVASPFWNLGRELLELRYLWDHAHSLDGAKFERLLPEFEATDIKAAIARALPANVQARAMA